MIQASWGCREKTGLQVIQGSLAPKAKEAVEGSQGYKAFQASHRWRKKSGFLLEQWDCQESTASLVRMEILDSRGCLGHKAPKECRAGLAKWVLMV